MLDRATWVALAFALLVLSAGCIGLSDEETEDLSETDEPDADPDEDPRLADANGTGPPPPPGEEVLGLEPLDLIFDGSLRHGETRVALVPPTHGDLSNPTNESRDALAYLEATLEGLFAWEPAIERFIQDHPEYSYLNEVSVTVDLLDDETPDKAGYDIVIGYVETSGPAFRGIAIKGPANEDQEIQRQLNEAGLGEYAHAGHRYVLLSLFASAPRAGQEAPDYPERHEMRGVTMHEFAHVWGLGHSTTWTEAYGPDLMNSPYPFVYGDGDPLGDGGERSTPLCVTSLNLYGLAHVYRWMPEGQWVSSAGNVSLPMEMPYERYCDAHEEAREQAQAWISDHQDRLEALNVPLAST